MDLCGQNKQDNRSRIDDFCDKIHEIISDPTKITHLNDTNKEKYHYVDTPYYLEACKIADNLERRLNDEKFYYVGKLRVSIPSTCKTDTKAYSLSLSPFLSQLLWQKLERTYNTNRDKIMNAEMDRVDAVLTHATEYIKRNR